MQSDASATNWVANRWRRKNASTLIFCTSSSVFTYAAKRPARWRRIKEAFSRLGVEPHFKADCWSLYVVCNSDSHLRARLNLLAAASDSPGIFHTAPHCNRIPFRRRLQPESFLMIISHRLRGKSFFIFLLLLLLLLLLHLLSFLFPICTQ